MLAYTETERDPNDLQLGGEFKCVTYSWKPYERRAPDHQADYRRLEKDIARRGFLNPLIVFRDCVLIGQRRCEIARKLGLSVVPCWEILDDITDDPNPDRVEELKQLYEKVDY